ncbi:DUF58 domain-containing protein [Vibrio hippocampi]|uniref:DUF58 domain-containing protein n=1 Tax=Vibrio hippocampi TaxID=654686 RepID=A0ABN8DJX9_9VIBR|nr:DUF58 domain-containing protein [Vibrio hippocampi]CAH0529654.1 hypothetical protein VHP8226_03409 [Vibrio hippocampi]
MAKATIDDSRIYVSYSQLIELQAQTHSFSLLPHLIAKGSMSGRNQSPFRGRGLNFEELRHYQLGDDIRNLDWKVTMRTGKPHVRTYTEEKDRQFILCVDQRSGMFFSSVETMKSVVAAQVAALSAWRIIKDSDRVGFVLIGADQVEYIKPQRSKHHLLHALRRLCDFNHALDISSVNQGPASLSECVDTLIRNQTKNATIIILSDWAGASETDIERLKYLQQRNDVLSVMIYDPLERKLPSVTNTQLVLGDGEYQLSVSESEKLQRANKGLKRSSDKRQNELSQLMAIHRLPLIELNTSGKHIEQFTFAIGGVGY